MNLISSNMFLQLFLFTFPAFCCFCPNFSESCCFHQIQDDLIFIIKFQHQEYFLCSTGNETDSWDLLNVYFTNLLEVGVYLIKHFQSSWGSDGEFRLDFKFKLGSVWVFLAVKSLKSAHWNIWQPFSASRVRTGSPPPLACFQMCRDKTSSARTCPLLQAVASGNLSISEQVFGTPWQEVPTFLPEHTHRCYPSVKTIKSLCSWWTTGLETSSYPAARACTGPTPPSLWGFPPQVWSARCFGPWRPEPRPWSSSSSSPASAHTHSTPQGGCPPPGFTPASLWPRTFTRSAYPVSLAVHQGWAFSPFTLYRDLCHTEAKWPCLWPSSYQWYAYKQITFWSENSRFKGPKSCFHLFSV